MTGAVGVTELAAEFKVSKDTVYSLARSGEIPAFKVGREWRFYVEDVKAKLSAPKDTWAQPARSHRARRAA